MRTTPRRRIQTLRDCIPWAVRIPLGLILLWLPRVCPGGTQPAVDPSLSPPCFTARADDRLFVRGKRSLSRFLEILPDPGGAWSVQEVSAAPLSRSFIPNLDYVGPVARHQAYWVRLTIQGDPELDEAFSISMEWPEVAFYEPLPSGGFTIRRTGYFVPFRERASPEIQSLFPLLPVQIPKGEHKTFYWRCSPTTHFYYRDILCWAYTPEFMRADSRVKRLGVGIFLGIIFASGLYHLVLFFFVRDKTYLYFGLFGGTFGLFWLYNFGYAAEFLWPSHPQAGYYSVGVLLPLVVFFWTRFFKIYLDTGVLMPKSDKALSWIPLPPVLLDAVLPFNYMEFIHWIGVFCMAAVALLLGIAFLCARKGSRPARVMLAAAGLFLTAMGYYGICLFGFLPSNAVTPFIPLAGLCLFEILFALGIADRLNTLRSEKEWAQAESLRKQEELEQARQLQLSMLPGRVPEIRGLDIAAHMATASEVGGDYYDFHVEDEGTLTMAIGDATGHGLKAGALVTATKGLFNLLTEKPDVSASVQEASRSLHRMGFQSMFMALILAKAKDGDLNLAGAGMPFPLLYRSSGGAVEEIPLEGMPLGILPDGDYPEVRLSLRPGDALLFMSDGFMEMFNGNREMLGFERAKQVFRECASGSAAQMIEHLVQAGGAWAQGRPPDDDVTFIVLKKK